MLKISAVIHFWAIPPHGSPGQKSLQERLVIHFAESLCQESDLGFRQGGLNYYLLVCKPYFQHALEYMVEVIKSFSSHLLKPPFDMTDFCCSLLCWVSQSVHRLFCPSCFSFLSSNCFEAKATVYGKRDACVPGVVVAHRDRLNIFRATPGWKHGLIRDCSMLARSQMYKPEVRCLSIFHMFKYVQEKKRSSKKVCGRQPWMSLSGEHVDSTFGSGFH